MSQASLPAITGLNAPIPPAEPVVFSQKSRRIGADFVLYFLCLGSALIVVVMLLALVVVLVRGAVPSMKQFGFGFLIHSEWRATEIAARGPSGKILYAYTALSPDKHVENTMAAVAKWQADRQQGR